MPKGILVFRWDTRSGSEIITSSPSSFTLDLKTLMQIYMNHESAGEAGVVAFSNADANLVSYFTGKDSYYYVVLNLEEGENFDNYEPIMNDLAMEIRPLFEREKSEEYLAVLEKYSKLFIAPVVITSEQRSLEFFGNEGNYTMYSRFKSAGFYSRSELIGNLQMVLGDGYMDVQTFVDPFLDEDIVTISRVKSKHEDYVFFVNDFYLYRVFPTNLESLIEGSKISTSVLKKYLTIMKKYFDSYIPTDEDAYNLARTLCQTQIWPIFSKLRNTLLSEAEFVVLVGNSAEKKETIIGILKQLNLVYILEDEDKKYYGLLCDIFITKSFATSTLNVVEELFQAEDCDDLVVIKYCQILAGHLAVNPNYRNAQTLLKKLGNITKRIKFDHLKEEPVGLASDEFEAKLQKGRHAFAAISKHFQTQ